MERKKAIVWKSFIEKHPDTAIVEIIPHDEKIEFRLDNASVCK
jgi:hypothetical protein